MKLLNLAQTAPRRAVKGLRGNLNVVFRNPNRTDTEIIFSLADDKMPLLFPRHFGLL
jgi:hypothetical protein